MWLMQTRRYISSDMSTDTQIPAVYFNNEIPTAHPPIQWVSGTLSLGVKRPGREPDHSPPSSAEVKNACSYTSIDPIRLHGVVLS
jgi:hypothetical protein